MRHPYNSVVLLLSGGIDSTTLLHSLVDDGTSVYAVSFRYGQMHDKELEYAMRQARLHCESNRIIDLPDIFAGSALTGDRPMPEGNYTDASMRQTVVPNRNMVFLSIAASIAIQRKAEAIAYAAHADDFGTYPDCRREFVEAMGAAIKVCDFAPPRLYVPFLDLRKRDIVALGRDLGIDYAQTWSCYAGGEEPCGKCGACSARNEAMAWNASP